MGRPARSGPQPVDGAVGQPRTLVRRREREAQAEHSRTLPCVHECPALRLLDREVAEDHEPIRMLPRGLDGQLVRLRIPRRVGCEHCGIDTARVHLAERVGLGVGGDLTVPWRRGVASVPEVDLGVDDQPCAAPSHMCVTSADRSERPAPSSSARVVEQRSPPEPGGATRGVGRVGELAHTAARHRRALE